MAAQAIFLFFPFIPLDKLTSKNMVSILSFFLTKALRFASRITRVFKGRERYII